MTRHLDELEISAAAAELDVSEWARSHLASCQICRAKVEAFRQLVSARLEEEEGGMPSEEEFLAAVTWRLRKERRKGTAKRATMAGLVLALAASLFGVYVLPKRQHVGTPVVDVERVLAEADQVLASDPLEPLSALDELVPSVAELEPLVAGDDI